MKPRFTFTVLLQAFLILVLFFSCKNDEASEVDFDVRFQIPQTAEIASDAEEFEFRIQFSKAPQSTDVIVMQDPEGVDHDCAITNIGKTHFSISLWSGMKSGKYEVSIRRGSRVKLMGEMTVSIVVPGADDLKPENGATIYGMVSCAGVPLEGVAVSDGFEVVRTDAKGIYQMKSNKYHKYVFISVPSGYEVISDGVFPEIHKQLKKSLAVAERVDFSLNKADDQTNHTMLIMGDMHMANRTNDRQQFTQFVTDVNNWVSSHTGEPIYGIQLGDITWDLYWYDNHYSFEEYKRDADAIKGLSIYHTIGNHDYDMKLSGDFATAAAYKKLIAPTYYSWNVGKVHYVVLDDIHCTNPGGENSTERTYYTTIEADQIEWLKKDLEGLDKSTPIVLSTHAPIYTDFGTYSVKRASALEQVLREYNEVHIFTGHTHQIYNVDYLESDNIYEHNSGAVCATWWWSAYETPGVHIGQDGAPGGYVILDVEGDKFSWKFKATGYDESYQFRTYDANNIHLTAAKYTPNASADNAKKFEDYADNNGYDWTKESKDNLVFLNIWNWDPSWKIEVTENGIVLESSKVIVSDPLHLIAYTAKRLNKNSHPTFATDYTRHMFKVQASSPNSTLEIKVTDRFGNQYKETMERPKQFSTDIYKR